MNLGRRGLLEGKNPVVLETILETEDLDFSLLSESVI